MLYFTRWKATAIVLTALIVCLFAVPNFLPEKMVQGWPKWAQRHVVLGLDLQGGSHILLEVDSAAVRKEKLEALRDDVRRVLLDARPRSAIRDLSSAATASRFVFAKAVISIRLSKSFANCLSLSAEYSIPPASGASI